MKKIEFSLKELRKTVEKIIQGEPLNENEIMILRYVFLTMSDVLTDYAKIVPAYLDYMEENDEHKFYAIATVLHTYLKLGIKIKKGVEED